jgi:hypothetical protein
MYPGRLVVTSKHEKEIARRDEIAYEAGFQKLNHDLLSIGGTYVSFNVHSKYAVQVQEHGKFTTGPVESCGMVHYHCHWNVAALYLTGKIDAIGTGYALVSVKPPSVSSVKKWIAHSWGTRGSAIIETTMYSGISAYYGITLTNKKMPPGVNPMFSADHFCMSKISSKLNESLAHALGLAGPYRFPS